MFLHYYKGGIYILDFFFKPKTFVKKYAAKLFWVLNDIS